MFLSTQDQRKVFFTYVIPSVGLFSDHLPWSIFIYTIHIYIVENRDLSYTFIQILLRLLQELTGLVFGTTPNNLLTFRTSQVAMFLFFKQRLPNFQMGIR